MKQKILRFLDCWKLYQERLSVYHKQPGQLNQMSLQHAEVRVKNIAQEVYAQLNPSIVMIEYQIVDPDNSDRLLDTCRLCLNLTQQDVYWVWNNFLKRTLFLSLSKRWSGSQGSKLYEGCLQLTQVHAGHLQDINPLYVKKAFLDKSKGD